MEEHWRLQAACRGVDTELFVSSARRNNYSAARPICEPCPVREECLSYAVENTITLGLWGGMSPRQRRAVSPFYSLTGDDDPGE